MSKTPALRTPRKIEVKVITMLAEVLEVTVPAPPGGKAIVRYKGEVDDDAVVKACFPEDYPYKTAYQVVQYLRAEEYGVLFANKNTGRKPGVTPLLDHNPLIPRVEALESAQVKLFADLDQLRADHRALDNRLRTAGI